MQILDFIVEEMYILIPVLYIIGMFLKKIPKMPDWLIPWILLGLGIIGGFFLAGMNFQGIFQGILVAGTSVFANQLFKQTKEKINGNCSTNDNSSQDNSQNNDTGALG